MDSSVQCNLVYRETSDKKSQTSFKGKTKGIQVDFSPNSSDLLSLGHSKLKKSNVKTLPEGSTTSLKEQTQELNGETNELAKNASESQTLVTIGVVGALQQPNLNCKIFADSYGVSNLSETEILSPASGKTISEFTDISETALRNQNKRKASDSVEKLNTRAAAKIPCSDNLQITNERLQGVLNVIKDRTDIDYILQHNKHSSVSCLEIWRKDSLQDIGGLHEVPVKIKFTSDGIVSVVLVFKPVIQETYWDSENLAIDPAPVFRAPNYLSETNTFCSGIKNAFHFGKPKSLEILHHPCERQQSKLCPILFRIPKIKSSVSASGSENGFMCPKCSSLDKYLRHRKKAVDVTPRTKLKRRHISSKFPIQDLTPKSRNIRFKNLRNQRYRLSKRILQMEKEVKENAITLNTEQSYELAQMLNEINLNHKDDFMKAISEVKKRNPLLSKAFKMSWKTDSENNKLSTFLKDQEKHSETRKGNTWSPLTYRLALTLYSRSPASYRALKSLQIFNLPSIHTIQKKVQKMKCDAGIDIEYLLRESEKFKTKFDTNIENERPPQEGFLVLDEVKVIGKMVWNANTNEFIGLAMDKEEIPSLHNFYKNTSVNECLAAQYVLQFIWRCAGQKFDVIGPYFPSHVPFTHEELTVQTQKSIFAFQSVGFFISAIICDGASSNLTMIKSSHGVTGQYSYTSREDGTLNFDVEPRFRNPLLPDRWIYWIICPSHQLKNLINGLSHSKEGGTRSFEKGNIGFGWKQIEDVEAREDERKKNLELSQVKGLRHAYIERDAWTKLNVTPAKILQQLPFLSELYNYANPNTTFLPLHAVGDKNNAICEEIQAPHDEKEVMACYDFLTACHNLFEVGFLSHKKVHSVESEPAQNILKGFKYFESWATETLKSNKDLSGKDGKTFLAWQTWDLLRVMVFGFLGFVKDFHQRNPSFYVYPVKVNGSVVESFFSQLRFVTAGKLTSTNYKTARRSILISADMKSPKKNEVQTGENAYRNVELNVSSILDLPNIDK